MINNINFLNINHFTQTNEKQKADEKSIKHIKNEPVTVACNFNQNQSNNSNYISSSNRFTQPNYTRTPSEGTASHIITEANTSEKLGGLKRPGNELLPAEHQNKYQRITSTIIPVPQTNTHPNAREDL